MKLAIINKIIYWLLVSRRKRSFAFEFLFFSLVHFNDSVWSRDFSLLFKDNTKVFQNCQDQNIINNQGHWLFMRIVHVALNLQSGIQLTIGVWNPRSTDKAPGIQYLESRFHGVESCIPDCLGFPHMHGANSRQLSLCVTPNVPMLYLWLSTLSPSSRLLKLANIWTPMSCMAFESSKKGHTTRIN